MKYLILFLLLTSCAAGKHFTEKSYICYEIYETSNKEVVHRFATLSLTEGRDEILDSVHCERGDTVVIKDYARGLLRKKRTVFILK